MSRRIVKLTPKLQQAAAARDYEKLTAVYTKRNSIGLLGLSALKLLRPPADDKAAYGRYVAAVADREAMISTLIPALQDRDHRLLQAAYGPIAAAAARAHEAAIALGARGCARSPGASPA